MRTLVPRQTDLIEHGVDIGDAEPITVGFCREFPEMCKVLDADRVLV